MERSRTVILLYLIGVTLWYGTSHAPARTTHPRKLPKDKRERDREKISIRGKQKQTTSAAVLPLD